MTNINEIHRRVFDVLLEHHYREKEAGRDFYFLTEVFDDYRAYMSFTDLYGEKKLERKQDIIVVNLFGDNKIQSLLQLIFHNQNLYICGRKGTNSDEEYHAIFNTIYSPEVPERFLYFKPSNIYGLTLKQKGSLEENLQYFLEKDWPNVVRLPSIPKKWFINKDSFEKYLSKSPFYIPLQKLINIALKSIEVTNFKGIKHILIENLPRGIKWIFLTGENGFGKTSILQAIAAGLNGRYDARGNELLPKPAHIFVDFYSGISEFISRSADSPNDISFVKVVNYLATYGPSRLDPSTNNITKEELERQSPPTYSLFNTSSILLDIEQRLKVAKNHFPEDFKQIIETLQALLPNLERIEIEVDNSTKLEQVKYFEKDDEGNLVNEGVTFTQLAAGYRNIIAMIGDMIYRLSTKQDVSKLSDLEGIVIIDELELHLHPKYQKLFVQKLTELFPHIQFIASTHSPIPLLGAPPETVILHVTRSEKRGIEVEKLDIDFSVLTPNAILTSPIFGFQELIPESKPDDTMIRSEQTYQEVLLNDQLDKQIDEYLTEENKEELLSLLKK
jgi:hypothetical protein